MAELTCSPARLDFVASASAHRKALSGFDAAALDRIMFGATLAASITIQRCQR
jgi:hypothetical protein